MNLKSLIIYLTLALVLVLLPTIVAAADPNLGTINPPNTVPTGGANPSSFVSGLISGIISLLLIVGFVIGLIWMIFAGYSFIFAGDDPKNISSAWSRIYWGLIGLVIIGGSFALIKLAETFLNVTIITGGGPFQLPQR